MAYLRWSGSDWYVFAHVNGGLAVWCCHARDDDRYPVYSLADVQMFLQGDRQLAQIPGWAQCSSISRMELLWTMRVFVGDEVGEDVHQIGDGPAEPSLRVKLRESAQQDRDHKAWRVRDGETGDRD